MSQMQVSLSLSKVMNGAYVMFFGEIYRRDFVLVEFGPIIYNGVSLGRAVKMTRMYDNAHVLMGEELTVFLVSVKEIKSIDIGTLVETVQSKVEMRLLNNPTSDSQVFGLGKNNVLYAMHPDTLVRRVE